MGGEIMIRILIIVALVMVILYVYQVRKPGHMFNPRLTSYKS